MVRILYNVLLMGVSGSLMFALSAITHKRMKERFARWYYALLVTAVMLFLIPVQTFFSSHSFIRITVPHNMTVSGGTPILYPTAAVHTVTVGGMIAALWAAVSLALFVIMLCRYFKTRKTLMQISRDTFDDDMLEAYLEVCSDMGIHREIGLRVSGQLNSPLLFGIVRPVIILPDKEFSHQELVMMLSHELTHYRHKDLLIKFAIGVVRCVHFFNPLVYLLGRAINEGCELCCDESVLDRLDLKDKKDYGRLIISVIESGSKSLVYSTAMASEKDKIQKRLLRIVQFKKPSRLLKTGSVMLAVTMGLCSITALGFDIAAEALPEEFKAAITYMVSGSGTAPFAQTLSGIKPQETTAPEATALPEITAAAVLETTAAPMVTAEPEIEAEAEAVKEEPLQEAEEYTFDTAAEEVHTEMLSEPAAADEAVGDTEKEISLDDTSYIFNPDFSESDFVRSDSFTLSESGTVAVSRLFDTRDCYISLYRVTETGDELLYDEKALNSNGFNLNFTLNPKERYYIIAEKNEKEHTSIWITKIEGRF